MSAGGATYVCNCIIGYNGNNCQFNSLSACYNNPCRNGGTCQITGTSYYCICQPGYLGANCTTCK